MSALEPTAEAFKNRYPEFSVVPDAIVSAVLEESSQLVADSWCESDRTPAKLLWTAHTLTLEGEPDRSQKIADGGKAENVSQTGSVSSVKVGDVAMTFSGRSKSSGQSVGGVEGEYRMTSYGASFWEILVRNANSILAT